MVDHDQNRVIAVGDRKIRDEVHRDKGKGACVQGFDRLQWRIGGVAIDFVLLTDSAAVYIILDEC